jgi:anti-sigma factor RsiW
MSEQITTTEQELHAYSDGQLGPEARREVEQRLQNDADAAAELADYDAIRTGLHQLYDPVLRERVPPMLTEPTQRIRQPWLAAAAGVVLMLGGLLVGLQLGGMEREAGEEHHHSAIPGAVARAYNTYAPEVRHPVEVGADQREYMVSWLSKRMGTLIVVPDLYEMGFKLIGGRLLSTEHGPGTLLMYENHSGQRLVFYQCNNPDGDESALRFEEAEGVPVSYWENKRYYYGVAGTLPKEELRRLAERAHHQVDS